MTAPRALVENDQSATRRAAAGRIRLAWVAGSSAAPSDANSGMAQIVASATTGTANGNG